MSTKLRCNQRDSYFRRSSATHGHRLIRTPGLHLIVSCTVLPTFTALEGERLGLVKIVIKSSAGIFHDTRATIAHLGLPCALGSEQVGLLDRSGFGLDSLVCELLLVPNDRASAEAWSIGQTICSYISREVDHILCLYCFSPDDCISQCCVCFAEMQIHFP